MDTLQFIGGDSRSIRAFRRVCANSDEPTPGGRDSGLLGVRPVVPFMSFEDLNRPSYQYLLVEVQCAKTTTLILWASVLALTVVVSGSYWIDLGLAVFAGPMQAAVAFSSRWLSFPIGGETTLRIERFCSEILHAKGSAR